MYEGDLVNSKAEGEGTFTGPFPLMTKMYKGGGGIWGLAIKYTGEWKLDRPHGFGTQERFDSQESIADPFFPKLYYQGHWRYGVPHGPGFMVSKEFYFIDGVFN